MSVGLTIVGLIVVVVVGLTYIGYVYVEVVNFISRWD